MPAGGEIDHLTEHGAVRVPCQLCGKGHAGIGTDVRVWVDIEDVKHAVAQTDIESRVVAAPDRPVCPLRDPFQFLVFRFRQSAGTLTQIFSYARESGLCLQLKS